eukprot:1160920-Pelagomonas_calceolata.AAC.1
MLMFKVGRLADPIDVLCTWRTPSAKAWYMPYSEYKYLGLANPRSVSRGSSIHAASTPLSAHHNHTQGAVMLNIDACYILVSYTPPLGPSGPQSAWLGNSLGHSAL